MAELVDQNHDAKDDEQARMTVDMEVGEDLVTWLEFWLASDAAVDWLGNHFARTFTRGKICFEHFVDRRWDVGRRLAASTSRLYAGCRGTGYRPSRKAATAISSAALRAMQAAAAGFGGFVGEAEAGEAGEVGLGEVELAEGGEVEGEGAFRTATRSG